MSSDFDVISKMMVGSKGTIYPYRAALDKWDNIYMSGHISTGNENGFALKVDTINQAAVWVKEYETYRVSDGATGYNDYTYDIAVTEYGGYVVIPLYANNGGVANGLDDGAILILSGYNGDLLYFRKLYGGSTGHMRNVYIRGNWVYVTVRTGLDRIGETGLSTQAGAIFKMTLSL